MYTKLESPEIQIMQHVVSEFQQFQSMDGANTAHIYNIFPLLNK